LFILSELAPELSLHIEAASVNHGLRKNASDDVEIARQQSVLAAVGFHSLSVKVSSEGSLQAQAREARYSALFELARDRNFSHVATGHTLDDQSETVFLRMLRGSGLRGLSSINPIRDDGVVRPLIDLSRADVHEYAYSKTRNIAIDPSNSNPRFDRVKVRTEFLPGLRKLNQNIDSHLARLADESAELFQWIDEVAKLVVNGQDRLSVSLLMKLPPPVRRAAIHSFIVKATNSVSGSHLDQTFDLCSKGKGEVWLSQTQMVIIHDDLLSVIQRT
jgi:tRNA(Ile)-lysidine synthase